MEDLNSQIDELLNEVIESDKTRRIAAANAFTLFQKNEKEEIYKIRIATDALITRLTLQGSREIENVNEEISYQISLLCSFVQAHFCINDLILGSSLVEAITLVRKQLESLARLHELDKKPIEKLRGRTPNIKNQLGEEFAQAYKPLSEVAHFATPEASDFLTIATFESGEQGPSTIPHYHPKAHEFYRIHLTIAWQFVFWLLQKCTEWYKGYTADDEYRLFTNILTAADEAGLFDAGKEK